MERCGVGGLLYMGTFENFRESLSYKPAKITVVTLPAGISPQVPPKSVEIGEKEHRWMGGTNLIFASPRHPCYTEQFWEH